jgi:carbonic anhydrase
MYIIYYICFNQNSSTLEKSEKIIDYSKMHNAKSILLTCIDFRFIDDIVAQMNKLGYLNNYDEFVLAGASLGYNGIPGYNNWAQVFNDHINLALSLHHIKEIIIIDHMDCGAYKKVYSPSDLEGPNEKEKHVLNLHVTVETLSKLYPQIKIRTFIINKEGTSMEDIH